MRDQEKICKRKYGHPDLKHESGCLFICHEIRICKGKERPENINLGLKKDSEKTYVKFG